MVVLTKIVKIEGAMFVGLVHFLTFLAVDADESDDEFFLKISSVIGRVQKSLFG